MAGNFVLVLLLCATAGVADWGMSRISAADQVALQRQVDSAALEAMQRYLLEQANSQDDLIISNNPARIEELRASTAALAETQEQLRAVVETAEEKQLLAEIEQLQGDFRILIFEQVVPAWQDGNSDRLAGLDDRSDELLNHIQDKIQDLATSFEQKSRQASLAAEAAGNETRNWMRVVSLVAAAISLGLGLFLSRSISRPIQAVTRAANRLAQGDVNQHVDITGRNEVGEMAEAFRQMIAYQQEMAAAADRLAEGDLTTTVTPQSDQDMLGLAFRQMIANLRGLIGQVVETATTVGAASGQLAIAAEQAGQASQQVAATIQQIAQGTSQQTRGVTEATSNAEQMARGATGIAKGAQEQAGGVQKTSTLVSDMASIVDQVGQVARSVGEANARVSQAARASVTTVGQASQGMDTIRTRTAATADKVKEMGARSREIGRIVETIDDIADKTDMLALNAAVEAARAGEHGRGFAVVADQVRKLSEDSKSATRDIATLIERVQDTVQEAIAAMDSTVGEVSNGARLTGETARSLEEILQAAEAATSMAGRIVEAVQQLKQKSDGVVAAIESVSAVVEENTAVAEEMAAGSQEVMEAMEGIATVAEENSASAEEVSASAEEMSAQVEEVVASAQELSLLADQLRTAVIQFQVDDGASSQNKWGSPSSPTRQPVKLAAGSNGSAKRDRTGS